MTTPGRRRPPILFGSVADPDPAALARAAARAIADGADVVEVRADAVADPAPEPLHAALPPNTPACYTLRSRAHGGRFAGSASRAMDLRERAAAAGFDWVDVEAPATGALPPLPAGVRTIMSWHDPAGVPADPAALYARLRTAGAGLVKIIGTAREPAEAAPLLALLPGAGDCAAWCQGEAGLPSRLLAWRAGSAALFGAADADVPAAPGQCSVRDLVRRYRLATLGPHTAVYAVCGDPVAHSRGPVLHNRVLAAAGCDAVYLPARTRDLPGTLAFLAAHGLAGASVTIPHKGAAAALPGATVDAGVRRSGSANTVRVTPTGWAVTSTDGLGAGRALAEALGEPVGARRVLVLGAGGTAAAVAFALAGDGAHVQVSGRTPARAAALADALGTAPVPWADRHAAGAAVVVNATPLGMAPDDPQPAEPARMAGLEAVLDCVYTPPDTPFLQAARAAGHRTASGVRMFLHQAHAQLAFWGIGVPFSAVAAAWGD